MKYAFTLDELDQDLREEAENVLRAFHNIVNDGRLYGLPMVLETPVDAIDEDSKISEDKSMWGPALWTAMVTRTRAQQEEDY